MGKSNVEYIKNFTTNTILGIIETSSNGDQTARSWPSYRILGYYRAANDWTTDFYGRVLSKGNSVANLIYNDQRGK